MSKRFAWLLGIGVLVSIGLLVACGSVYNASADGLVVVSSQGSGLLQTYSFSLTSGHSSSVSNPPADTGNEVCVLNGVPAAILIDPAGAYAYAIMTQTSTCGSAPGIQAFRINSNGTIAPTGTLTSDPNPIALAMDTAGKFLFVVEGLNSVPPPGTPQPNQMACPGTTSQRGVCVYAIGSGGTLTPVPGTFTFNLPPNFQTPNFAALALTPLAYPAIGVNGVQNAECSTPGLPEPTAEYLYVADSVNNVVYEFGVDISTGVVTNLPTQSAVSFVAAGAVPSGVAVDPCNRFVYVSDLQSNQISAYTMCNGLSTQSPSCAPPTSRPAGSLVLVTGSPFSLTSGNGPGPLVVDPFGTFLYTLDTLSNQISILKIAQVSGALTSDGTAATGLVPISIAIRGDDNWLFVTNSQATSLSQYSVTPATGALIPMTAISTDNLPWGVAVK